LGSAIKDTQQDANLEALPTSVAGIGFLAFFTYNGAIHNNKSPNMRKLSSLHNWIGNLPDDIQEVVLQRMRPRLYSDGEAVYNLGEEGHELYRIESGRIRFCNYSLSGKEVQFGEIRAGDCFGELSLLDGLFRANSAFAQGSTELLVLQQDDFRRLSARFPEINLQITKLLSHRFRLAYGLIEDASLLTMSDRLARLLARLGYSVGVTDAQGVTTLEGFTHENLARMLGTTREGVSRELKHLEQAELIQRHYGKLIIPDLSAFVERCDSLVSGELIVPDYKD
jgi:CRP-like cAMP-binding protein